MGTGTVFDLASLTKVCATLPAALQLIQDGKLSIHTAVSAVLPEFQGEGTEQVRILHLLGHCSGLPAWRKFHLELHDKDAIVAAAAREPLEYAPGTKTVYSDLGLILLMACIEKVADRPFEDVVQELVFEPLHMHGARFARSGTPIDAAPTEQDPWRGRLVRGEVHDENAFAMGGVSGHAGMFATAREVARVGHLFLGGGRGLLHREMIQRAIAPLGIDKESRRAMLWDTFQAGGSGGSLLSAKAFGHTGFTGTSIWCDPETDLCIVLLTNRVHPSRENKGIDAARREVCDLVARAVLRP
jgi:CubicO group peptidase (beta-lactamase class C family)